MDRAFSSDTIFGAAEVFLATSEVFLAKSDMFYSSSSWLVLCLAMLGVFLARLARRQEGESKQAGGRAGCMLLLR